jgi:polysaccharide transporter, PST family
MSPDGGPAPLSNKPSTPGSRRHPSLAQSAARGAAATLSGRALRILLQLTGVLLLARLLSPSDFGVVGMVVAFTGIGELLRDFGLTSATIQSATLSKQQRDTLLWLSGAMGLGVGVPIWALAPVIGMFHGNDQVVLIARCLAVVFPVNGLTAQYRANMARELRFFQIQVSDLAPAALGLAVAIGMGLLGFGYWSLVMQQITQSAAGLLVAAALGRWIPGLPSRKCGIQRFVRYGLGLFGSQFLGYLTKNFDSITVGFRFGTQALGFYNRAYELVINSTNQIIMPSTNVGVSILSKLDENAARHSAFLIQGHRALT